MIVIENITPRQIIVDLLLQIRRKALQRRSQRSLHLAYVLLALVLSHLWHPPEQLAFSHASLLGQKSARDNTMVVHDLPRHMPARHVPPVEITPAGNCELL